MKIGGKLDRSIGGKLTREVGDGHDHDARGLVSEMDRLGCGVVGKERLVDPCFLGKLDGTVGIARDIADHLEGIVCLSGLLHEVIGDKARIPRRPDDAVHQERDVGQDAVEVGFVHLGLNEIVFEFLLFGPLVPDLGREFGVGLEAIHLMDFEDKFVDFFARSVCEDMR